MSAPPQRTYTCAWCKNVYEKGWPDEAAEQECLEVYGVDPQWYHCDIVCDDCYRKRDTSGIWDP